MSKRPHRLTRSRTINPLAIVHSVCEAAARPEIFKGLPQALRKAGINQAVRDRNTAVLFDWLMDRFSFQGVSDAVVEGYLGKHGNVSFDEIGAVDRLVHNFFRRTGILANLHSDHTYGAGCYASRGCAGIIDRFARQIDARALDPDLPAYFPRFIQHAVWAYCAQQELNICNGNRIDDRARCQQKSCSIYRECGRVALKPSPSRSPGRSIRPAARSPPGKLASMN
jgi:hypothetical protein